VEVLDRNGQTARVLVAAHAATDLEKAGTAQSAELLLALELSMWQQMEVENYGHSLIILYDVSGFGAGDTYVGLGFQHVADLQRGTQVFYKLFRNGQIAGRDSFLGGVALQQVAEKLQETLSEQWVFISWTLKPEVNLVVQPHPWGAHGALSFARGSTEPTKDEADRRSLPMTAPSTPRPSPMATPRPTPRLEQGSAFAAEETARISGAAEGIFGLRESWLREKAGDPDHLVMRSARGFLVTKIPFVMKALDAMGVTVPVLVVVRLAIAAEKHWRGAGAQVLEEFEQAVWAQMEKEQVGHCVFLLHCLPTDLAEHAHTRRGYQHLASEAIWRKQDRKVFYKLFRHSKLVATDSFLVGASLHQVIQRLREDAPRKYNRPLEWELEGWNLSADAKLAVHGVPVARSPQESDDESTETREERRFSDAMVLEEAIARRRLSKKVAILQEHKHRGLVCCGLR
jgi:hypothetical protein